MQYAQIYLDVKSYISKDECSEEKSFGWGEREGYEEPEGLTSEEGSPAHTVVHRRDGTSSSVHLVTLQ